MSLSLWASLCQLALGCSSCGTMWKGRQPTWRSGQRLCWHTEELETLPAYVAAGCSSVVARLLVNVQFLIVVSGAETPKGSQNRFN